jgi:hypothetical protein
MVEKLARETLWPVLKKLTIYTGYNIKNVGHHSVNIPHANLKNDTGNKMVLKRL